jgi:DNA invertase Pin-like site-specific DNA recombinase
MQDGKQTPQMIGYIRASVLDADSSLQRQALENTGCRVIFDEGVSDPTEPPRRELQTLIGRLGPGDTVLVTRMDRLARNVRELRDVVRQVHEKGATLRAIEEDMDTGRDEGRQLLNILAIFAEFEASSRRERQLQGVAKAKASGVYKGRKAQIDTEQIIAMRRTGMSPVHIAQELGIARSSVYRVLGLSRSKDLLETAGEDVGEPSTRRHDSSIAPAREGKTAAV